MRIYIVLVIFLFINQNVEDIRILIFENLYKTQRHENISILKPDPHNIPVYINLDRYIILYVYIVVLQRKPMAIWAIFLFQKSFKWSQMHVFCMNYLCTVFLIHVVPFLCLMFYDQEKWNSICGLIKNVITFNMKPFECVFVLKYSINSCS